MEEEKGTRDISREAELRSNESYRSQMANSERNLASETLVYTREILGTLREKTKSLEGQVDLQRSLRTLATQINKSAEQSSDTTAKKLFLLESEKDIQKEIDSAIKSRERLISETNAAAKQISIINEKNKRLEEDILELKKDQTGDSDKEIESLEKRIQANEGIKKVLSDTGSALRDLITDVDTFTQKAQEAKDNFQKISDIPESRLLSGLSESLKQVPLLSGFFEDATKEAGDIFRERRVNQEELKDRVSTGKGLTEDYFKRIGIQDNPLLKGKGGKLLTGTAAASKLKGTNIAEIIPKGNVLGKSLSAAFSKLGPVITKALGPLGIIIEVIQALGKADKEVVEIQKSFAASRGEAMGIRTELAGAAAASGNINITTTKLLGTLTSISDQFGFIAKFSADTLVTATKLTEQVGLSADAAGQLAAASVATGTSLEENYENVLGASYELQRQKGVQFDLRKILEATAKVTGQVRANLGSNPVEIAKAVTQAKLFGAEMDDIVSSSRSLLDFQSSIESELEAELLLGRDLNLERARSAALMGDMETVAKELTKQAGDYTDFSNLNVIQQDALARSLGMQSDQLADILFKQEIQGKTARELRAVGRGELADRLEAQTLADKFNATIEKLKGIFTDVATAFMPVLSILGAVLSAVGAIVGGIGDLIKLLGVVTGFRDDFGESGFLNGIQGTLNSLGGDFTFADDAMIPSSHQGGKTLLGPEGSIKFNKEDTIVAGTDLFGDRSLSQMPDYESVLGEAKTQINPISTIEPTSTINTGMASTVNNNQTQINQESEELVNQMKAMNASINKQTEILAKGQNTIAKTKTKLTLGASSFGTDLNVNSFSIQ